MDRIENIDFCIRYLMQQDKVEAEIPDSLVEKQQLLRALMNIWEPQPLSDEFLQAQDAELQAQLKDKGEVNTSSFFHQTSNISVWQGDITRLKVDAIVNAANSRMLGCWHPLHGCIDNAIHSAAGLQLRAECADAMSGAECPKVHPEYTMGNTIYSEAFTSETIITSGYNLPAKYVVHTVGPIIPDGIPTSEQEQQLAWCYENCIGLAMANGCKSIAFCCISTGEYRFPNRRAAEIAINTVAKVLAQSSNNAIKVVFNVFKDIDYDIYRELLGTH